MQKAAFEKIINLNTKEIMSAEKTIVALVFKIDCGNIQTAMALMNRNTMILFQIVVLLLVFCLIDIVTKEQ